MIKVAQCIVFLHDFRLVVLAAAVCLFGSWITFRLFSRGVADTRLIGLGWHFLAATAAGSSIWTTHFIAILAYDVQAPVSFDPVLTISSLLVAICGTFIGFAIAGGSAVAPLILGGAIIGASAATMHYLGMMGYHISGIIHWDPIYVGASVVISMVVSTVAVWLAVKGSAERARLYAALAFVGGIVLLHFTGMTALEITPLVLRGSVDSEQSFLAMALSISLACFVMAGAGLTSFILDSRTREESFKKLHDLAFYDSLTGLANRPNLTKRLDEMCEESDEIGKPFVYIGMDLDRFKEVNDVRGHAAGDIVLSELGERLNALQSAEISFARIGGDEFAALSTVVEEQALSELLYRIKSEIRKPIYLDRENSVSVGVSLGVARFPYDAFSAQELVSRADLAMYRAKADPALSICYYDAAMDEAIRGRKALSADLRKALIRKELELHYQVQTSVASGEVSGYEVLLRWKHPERGFVPPSEFIPLAEDGGMILDIGRWVLRTACQQAATWPNNLKIAVNLSAIQFSDATLPEQVHQILQETGLSPRRLELELTESTIVENRERTLEMISRIKALGVTIALDDFGTGYSSLETLRSFPFDKIKLDRSFMTEIEESAQARAIVRAVLALGKSLDVPVLAEGVETKHQLDILNSEGCDAAQGYYLGRPVPLATILTGFETLDGLANGNVTAIETSMTQHRSCGIEVGEDVWKADGVSEADQPQSRSSAA